MDKIKDEYNRVNSWGISTSIDLHSCNPKFVRDAGKIKEFVVQLCELIKVKRFGKCIVINFGEKEDVQGFSMTQLIDTSLLSGHFANKTNNIYLDIFSCKYYNPHKVVEFCKNFFQAEDYTLNYNFRR